MATLECHSKGDKRFSAFYAYVTLFGKKHSIEQWYQNSKVFKDTDGTTFSYPMNMLLSAKGKTARFVNIRNTRYNVDKLSDWYKFLWLSYFIQNKDLYKYSCGFDKYHDMFKGHSINNQEDVIKEICKYGLYACLFYINDFITSVFGEQFWTRIVDLALKIEKEPKNIPCPIKEQVEPIEKGTLFLSSVSDLKRTVENNEPIDVKLFIVRQPGKFKYKDYGLQWIPQLSPSEQLFKDTCRWKREGNKDWWKLYVPRFMKEMKDHTFQRFIGRIEELLDQGKNVLLVCFCGSYLECHRGLIGCEEFKKGYNIEFGELPNQILYPKRKPSKAFKDASVDQGPPLPTFQYTSDAFKSIDSRRYIPSGIYGLSTTNAFMPATINIENITGINATTSTTNVHVIGKGLDYGKTGF